jgi:predicted GNAT family acetyltransferase
MADTRVVDNPAESRFDIIAAGQRAGLAAYRRNGDTIEFTHTEIDPKFSGRGLGSQLVRAALDAARSGGLAVLPYCPFVREYIQRHREYVDLVPADKRPRFDLAE